MADNTILSCIACLAVSIFVALMVVTGEAVSIE